ncbi:unnamed protein product [Arctia plantaginis]|uniref:ZAD domain-containing protein n=1 Tax=Arctia plantaginis TaxID=874455 RepID=A0A8S1AWI8_ARCPL|nr:unnamed protein product [Arctia plantaginis]
MEKPMMCRLCLVQDVRMHMIVNTNLQETYEKLTDIPLETKDSKPVLACYICWARLQNCYILRTNCLWSEELLTDMIKSNALQQFRPQDVPMARKLEVTPVRHISTVNVAEENSETFPAIDVKLEIVEETHQRDQERKNFNFDDQMPHSEAHVLQPVKKEPEDHATDEPGMVELEPILEDTPTLQFAQVNIKEEIIETCDNISIHIK